MNLDPNQLLQSIVEFGRTVRKLIVDSFNTKDWFILSLVLLVIVFLLFEPQFGLISKSIPGEKPVLYSTIFWTIEVALLLLGILLELAKYILRRAKNLSSKGLISFGIIASMVLAALLVLNSSYQSIKGAARPTYYMPCIRSNDCFSWGENALFSYGYFENNLNLDEGTYIAGNESFAQTNNVPIAEPDWQSRCRKAWRLKASATSLYYTDKAYGSIEKFRGECKTDAESQIYLNNIEAISDDQFRLPLLGRGKTNVGIGVSLPISREGGESESQEILRGVAIAQRKTNNDNNIASINILVGIADDGFDNQGSDRRLDETDRAKEIASGLVKMEEIVGVVGHFSSDATAKAGIEVYDKSKSNLVAISPTSTAVRQGEFSGIADALHKDTGVNLGNRVFRTALNDTTVIYRLVDELLPENESEDKKRYTKVAVVYEEASSYSKSFKEVFENIFVGEKGGAVLEDPGKCNFSATANYKEKECLDAAKAQDMEALLLIPSTKSSKGIRDLIILNHAEYKIPLFGADGMYDASFLYESTEGMMIYVPWHRDFEDAGSETFVSSASEIFDTTELNWRTAMAYDAANVIIQGVKNTTEKYCYFESIFSRIGGQSKKYTSCLRENLALALEDSSFKSGGVLGAETVFFKENHDRNESLKQLGTFVQVRENERGDGYMFSSLPKR